MPTTMAPLNRLLAILALAAFRVRAVASYSVPFGRQLQTTQDTCDNATSILKNEYPLNNDCSCRSSGSTGGMNANVTCAPFCNTCAYGQCGKLQVSLSLEYESDQSVMVHEKEQCFVYTSGALADSQLCLAEYEDRANCSLTINGMACDSCEYANCADGSVAPKIDCSSLDLNDTIHLCPGYAVADNSSVLIVLDKEYDTGACTSGGNGVFGQPTSILASLLRATVMAFVMFIV